MGIIIVFSREINQLYPTSKMIAYAILSNSSPGMTKSLSQQGQALQRRDVFVHQVHFTRYSLFSHRRQGLLQLGLIAYTNLVALFANDMIPGGQNTQGMIKSYHLMETAATDAVIFSQ